MAGVPVYTPGGEQQTQQQRPNEVSADMFGAQEGRALEQVAQGGDRLASVLLDKGDDNDKAAAISALSQAKRRQREAMYDPNTGLLNKTGENAKGVTGQIDATNRSIYDDVSQNLTSDHQRQMFAKLWQPAADSATDSMADFEFKQNAQARTTAKTSALSNLQDDAVANYDKPDMLANDFNTAREMIRANPDGLPDAAVKQIEREGISGMHVSVIQRLSQDDPGKALDYYEAHKSEVNGADHAKASSLIKGVSQARQASTAAQEIADTGPAHGILNAIEQTESSGDPSAQGFRPNSQGQRASGLMQVMPDTAREQAAAAGHPEVAGMDDKQMSAYFATPAGQTANRQIGAMYFNKQLTKYNGDMEASLIAYNAGPANADKFLNAGRDYSVLPEAEETYGYVKKVVGNYLGVDLKDKYSADGSAAIQQATRGVSGSAGQRYNGDSQAFLMTKLAPGKPESYVTGMQPLLRDGLAAMMTDAPDYVKAGLGVVSGARSDEKQAELWQAALKKYGSEAEARKWVAPPGKSQHNSGNAADLGWNGDLLTAAPPEVVNWLHSNAQRYGLTFPLSNENWHVETEGARKGGRVTRADTATARINAAFTLPDPAAAPAGQMSPAGFNTPNVGTVAYGGDAPSAASIYTTVAGPYSVQQGKANLDDWLGQARSRYADNPPLLAEVERQLTDKFNTQKIQAQADIDTTQKQVFARLMQGGEIKDEDPSVLQKIGPEGVSKLITLEGKFKKNAGEGETDEQTYYDLTKKMADPESFKDLNLIDYADKLSKQDFKAFADKQAALARPATRAEATAGFRTRTQLVDGMVDTLGLDPKPGSDDAKKVANLNKALDEKIAVFNANNPNKTAEAPDIQKMLDGLVVQGRTTDNWLLPNTTKMAFELSPEEKATFAPASGFTDIPDAAKPAVATGYTKIYGFQPNEEGAVSFYNDMARVGLGAAPAPPKQLVSQIRQMYSQKYGRAPTAEEQSQIYMRLIQKATGIK